LKMGSRGKEVQNFCKMKVSHIMLSVDAQTPPLIQVHVLYKDMSLIEVHPCPDEAGRRITGHPMQSVRVRSTRTAWAADTACRGSRE